MPNPRVFVILLVALLMPLASAQALYGTVEFADGRTITGQIKPSQSIPAQQSQDQIGLFVPRESANRLIPLVDVKRILFNWRHNPSSQQPYFLQQEGDIQVTLVTGEVVSGAYFGSAPGARQFLVVLDTTEQVPVVFNDTKKNFGDCIRSIDFQTVHVPEPAGAAPEGLTSAPAGRVDYRLALESADLLSSPGGKAVAKIHQGTGLTALVEKGGWVKVLTVGLVEVEGWIPRPSLQAERIVNPKL